MRNAKLPTAVPFCVTFEAHNNAFSVDIGPLSSIFVFLLTKLHIADPDHLSYMFLLGFLTLGEKWLEKNG